MLNEVFGRVFDLFEWKYTVITHNYVSSSLHASQLDCHRIFPGRFCRLYFVSLYYETDSRNMMLVLPYIFINTYCKQRYQHLRHVIKPAI